MIIAIKTRDGDYYKTGTDCKSIRLRKMYQGFEKVYLVEGKDPRGDQDRLNILVPLDNISQIKILEGRPG